MTTWHRHVDPGCLAIPRREDPFDHDPEADRAHLQGCLRCGMYALMVVAEQQQPPDEVFVGFTTEPDRSDPAQAFCERVEQAIKREFEGDPQAPRIVCVVESPPVGRIGVVGTGDDALDNYRMLTLGCAAMRVGAREASQRN